MKILNERPERHVNKITMRLGSTRQGMKWLTLAPPRTYECGHGQTVKMEDYEQGMVEIDFVDTHEIDEMIMVLTKFREQTRKALGEWE